VAAARAALAARPRRRREFERLLATAQRSAALREEIVAPFTLGWPVLRRAALRLGEGLVRARVLGARDEVFFLTEREVVGALRGGAGAGGGGTGLSAAAARRRQEWERRRALAPPLRLGQAPRAFQRGLERLEPPLAPPAGPTAALRGRPASPGRATGPVRLLHGPAEFDALRPGEVLVAPATAPAWTPLFARAAAVVTDTGGVLAHTSLVAREYGIPAVVGTGDATVRLRTGQVVTVDGDAGVVQVQPGA
jgi:pyruvate,water dikinase